MLTRLKDYLLLPNLVTSFEDEYLKRTNRVASVFLLAHLPFMVTLAYFNETNPALAAILTTAVLVGPICACKFATSRRLVSMVHGVASMLMGGLLVHFGQGPVQIEMHFYFFVLLALLAVFANPLVIVGAATTAALHHALLWLLLPDSVFNYDAPFWVVGVHAAFVVLESVAACFIARSFFDNVIGLEKIVEQRTAQVEARNQDMRMILNSVEEGFLTIDRDGKVQAERSAAVEELLGPLKPDDKLTDVLARHDAKIAEWFEFGLDEVFEGLLPVEVTVDQLPDKIVAHERSLSIRYFPVMVDEELNTITVVVCDITAEVARQNLEAESRELLTMLERITHDRHGFLEYFQEAEKTLEILRQEPQQDIVLLKRRLHTLKGNASVFGLHRLADACHKVEEHVAEFGVDPGCEEWTQLFACWANVRGNLRRLVSDNSNEHRLTDEQYSELLLGLLNRVPIESLAPKVAAWKLDPIEQRLQRISTQAKQLALRLGKGEIEVHVESNGLRTEASTWSGFWGALVHVVRNAVDHGLETIEDRCLANKAEFGRLTVKTVCEEDKFVVSVADDGRGMDWDRIATAAAKQGLPTSTQKDLVNAIFADGLSTRSTVSETSGRGVGLSALKQECEELGGVIEVQSTLGDGTEFRFVFPLESMAPKLHGLLISHGIDPDLVAMVAA